MSDLAKGVRCDRGVAEGPGRGANAALAAVQDGVAVVLSTAGGAELLHTTMASSGWRDSSDCA